MTRDEVLREYRPIRAGIQRVIAAAMPACGRADMARAARQVLPGALEEELEDDAVVVLLADVALFEPNQRGRRVFDKFLAAKAGRLDEADRALAGRMAGAWFSIFRLVGRHEAAGMWIEDLLDGNRRLWLVDEKAEDSGLEGRVYGMRLFDAGPFHAAFSILVAPDEETLEFCLAARAHGERLPFRHSLAATLYGHLLHSVACPE